jgi:hypothetical protein
MLCKLGAVTLVTTALFGFLYVTDFDLLQLRGFGLSANDHEELPAGIVPVPQALLKDKIYTQDDFINAKGIRPPFWSSNNTLTWGPCYAPKNRVDWKRAASQQGDVPMYHRKTKTKTAINTDTFHKKAATAQDLSDYCRPGFLIIGAGKCGTSSLYHYITDHPRVLPASEKQIHYFKVSVCHTHA